MTETPSGKPCRSKGTTGDKLLASMKETENAASLNTSRTLVLFSYYETARAKRNLQFFSDNGMFVREDVDWLFVANSFVCVDLPDHDSVGIIFRDNTCYDLGSFKETIEKYDFDKKYGRIITMNASVRGPFMPQWSRECWLDKFTGHLSETVKLVGTTINCQRWAMDREHNVWMKNRPHLQSMILAIDREAVRPLIELYRCFDDKDDAIFEGEVRNIMRMRQLGWKVYAFNSQFQEDSIDIDSCDHGLTTEIHPYEVMFIKIASYLSPELTDDLTRAQQTRTLKPNHWCTHRP
jgi:hypothetical protein